MARIRSIKPEFWSSEQVMECSPMARLLFIGLWNFCDDAGRHVSSPKTLKAEVFPSDAISPDQILGWLRELCDNGLLLEYEADGKKYLQVTGWKHQRIDKPSVRHPAPAEFVEWSSNGRRMVVERPPAETETETERSGGEGSGKEKEIKPGRPGVLRSVSKELLKDNEQLASWVRKAMACEPPLLPPSEASWQTVFALAEHALSIGAKPAALFVATVRDGDWKKISDASDESGRRRLNEYRRSSTGPPSSFAAEMVASMRVPDVPD